MDDLFEQLANKIINNQYIDHHTMQFTAYCIELQNPKNSKNLKKNYFVTKYKNKILEEKMGNFLKYLIHPNLIKSYGFFLINNKHYFVQEHIKTNLQILSSNIWIRAHISLLKNIIYQILKGLNFLHSNGIIHRDLKPESIGIKNNGYIKIFEFSEYGICSDLTQTITGCMQYQSPEVLKGRKYDASKDIWALGLIIYEMFYEKVLYEVQTNFGETLEVIAESLNYYFNINICLNNKERELKRFLKKCLCFEPEERASALELMNDGWLIESAIFNKKNLLISRTRSLLANSKSN